MWNAEKVRGARGFPDEFEQPEERDGSRNDAPRIRCDYGRACRPWIWREGRGRRYKTLRLIASSDLRVLDPIWTTAGISRAHGYMVFDTPFALSGQITSQLHPILALLGPPPISLVDMYVLHSDLLLAFAAVTIECIEQHRMRAGELVRLGLRF
jgi:hypothetical protein